MCRVYHGTEGWYVRCCCASRYPRGTRLPVTPGQTVWHGHDAREISARLV